MGVLNGRHPTSPGVWFVLQLANFLQIQKHHRSTNREQRIASQRCHIMCVVCITACKLFTNTKASSLNQPSYREQRIAVNGRVKRGM
jgi:hypothetical protein